ncbi:hypothetical protein GOP47_0013507 [Adiantum capillus-veneris]|uniref:Uncharacterized protein n=1 Tax=Adiantum capillus-veneris TaxID=13818 RepID=A0A9D4UNV2_ADICA|nr:hypothetical protein GOP47_0013507 [Adiantum capillus-veneris]
MRAQSCVAAVSLSTASDLREFRGSLSRQQRYKKSSGTLLRCGQGSREAGPSSSRFLQRDCYGVMESEFGKLLFRLDKTSGTLYARGLL